MYLIFIQQRIDTGMNTEYMLFIIDYCQKILSLMSYLNCSRHRGQHWCCGLQWGFTFQGGECLRLSRTNLRWNKFHYGSRFSHICLINSDGVGLSDGLISSAFYTLKLCCNQATKRKRNLSLHFLILL